MSVKIFIPASHTESKSIIRCPPSIWSNYPLELTYFKLFAVIFMRKRSRGIGFYNGNRFQLNRYHLAVTCAERCAIDQNRHDVNKMFFFVKLSANLERWVNIIVFYDKLYVIYMFSNWSWHSCVWYDRCLWVYVFLYVCTKTLCVCTKLVDCACLTNVKRIYIFIFFKQEGSDQRQKPYTCILGTYWPIW